jgi:hypothetical protein
MFLNHSSDTAAVVADLNAKKVALEVNETISGAALIAQGFGDPTKDPAVPDVVGNPSLKKTVYSGQVSTKQVAPTILKALGLNPGALKGVVIEGTTVLPGF